MDIYGMISPQAHISLREYWSGLHCFDLIAVDVRSSVGPLLEQDALKNISCYERLLGHGGNSSLYGKPYAAPCIWRVSITPVFGILFVGFTMASHDSPTTHLSE